MIEIAIADQLINEVNSPFMNIKASHDKNISELLSLTGVFGIYYSNGILFINSDEQLSADVKNMVLSIVNKHN